MTFYPQKCVYIQSLYKTRSGVRYELRNLQGSGSDLTITNRTQKAPSRGGYPSVVFGAITTMLSTFEQKVPRLQRYHGKLTFEYHTKSMVWSWSKSLVQVNLGQSSTARPHT